jgi:hypothetical protein
VDLMSVGKFARSRLTGKRNIMYEVKAQPPPRVDGAAGAASLIYHGEVNQDSDGPVEFCWPMPQDLAGQLAASFPGLTLRTEPAHQEAYIHLGQDPVTAAQSQLALPLRDRVGAA